MKHSESGFPPFCFVLHDVTDITATWPEKMEGEEGDLVETSVATGDTRKDTGTAEPFSEVRRRRKRARGTDMDTSEGATGGEGQEASVKRPSFPPVNVSTSLVSLWVPFI